MENRFNSLLCYGATKSGKTREIGAMALYIWEKYKKRTRLISADGGGWGSIQDYVDAGLVEPLNISDHPTPLTVLRRLSRGDWPVTTTWVGENGDKRTDPTKWYPRGAVEQQFSQVGMYAIEGFASICSLLMQDQVEKGRKIAEDVVGKFTEKDSDTGESMTFGNPARAHYGFVQTQLLSLIREFNGLSSLGINQILFTSLESQGEDEFTKRKTLGPAAIGQALTASISQRVGDLLHLTIANIEKDKKPAIEYRAYFKNHVDPDVNRSWPASLRLGPGVDLGVMSPELSKGYMVLTDDNGVEREGVSKLFRLRDAAQMEGANKLREIMNIMNINAKEKQQNA